MYAIGCDVSLGILIRLASSEEEEASRLYSNHSSVILELINHLAVKFKEDQVEYAHTYVSFIF